ncbi:MAG TPA: transposase [Ktedonobacterales bacterium]|nr:transposase [Ktedonobacterales bacterium]
MEQQSSSVRKTNKYKLMPTPDQERALEVVLWCCRDLYNTAFEERKTAWERCHVSISYYQQKAELPDLKADFPDYAQVNAQVLQDVILLVERTFQAFFRRVQAGEKPGYPRFQGWGRYSNFTYPQYGWGAVLDGGVLSLSKIGRIRIRLHRPVQGTPKTVTISREADGWYACISGAKVPIQPLPPTGQETGIDLGLKVVLTTADAEVVENPRHYRKAERALRKAQRRVARRKKGGNRRSKAVALLRRKHQQIARQRRDFHHKAALALRRQYEVIYLEDLRVASMVRTPHLAKCISDAGWAAFRTMLEGKAVYAGRRVIAVPPAFTTQDCSGVLPDGSPCPERVQKSLSVRTHACPRCGLVVDRDQNAALNILRSGRRERGAGQAPQASTWADTPSVA